MSNPVFIGSIYNRMSASQVRTLIYRNLGVAAEEIAKGNRHLGESYANHAKRLAQMLEERRLPGTPEHTAYYYPDLHRQIMEAPSGD